MFHHTVKFKRAVTAATLLDQNAVNAAIAAAEPPPVPDPISPELLLEKIASAMQRIEKQDNTDDVVA